MFFVIDKKKLVLLSGIFILSTTLAGTITARAVKLIMSPKVSVIIDAGHGEPDGGCVGALGSIEQEINLSVAKKTAEILEAKNISTLMTRSNSLGLWTEKSKTIREKKIEDMHNRAAIMKKSRANLFISIHMNSYPNSSAQGLRIFYDRNHEEIKRLAESIQEKIGQVTGAKTSAVKPADKSLFLLKDTPMPSILVECGFLTNPQEEKKLTSSEYQAKLAWAIADAVEKYFNQ